MVRDKGIERKDREKGIGRKENKDRIYREMGYMESSKRKWTRRRERRVMM